MLAYYPSACLHTIRCILNGEDGQPIKKKGARACRSIEQSWLVQTGQEDRGQELCMCWRDGSRRPAAVSGVMGAGAIRWCQRLKAKGMKLDSGEDFRQVWGCVVR